MKPVYFINGFLESGKTSFLKFTIAQDYFKIKGTTLLILCEEGEEEYDSKLLKKSKTIIEKVENEEDFTVANLAEMEKRWRPERIIIEYNGMWNNKDVALPEGWTVEQQITCVDANSFPMYFNNMKSMVAEMVRKSELIIFNRCDNCRDSLGVYRRNMKSINSAAAVVFEDANGEIDEIFEEDLPYDLKSEEIVLDDNSYGLWYLDVMDHIERYEGKKITFVANVLRPKQLPDGCIVPGRRAMTCCADDITFLGYVCKYDKAATIADKSWIKLTCTVAREFWAGYKGEGPVLRALSVTQCEAPKNEVIGFN